MSAFHTVSLTGHSEILSAAKNDMADLVVPLHDRVHRHAKMTMTLGRTSTWLLYLQVASEKIDFYQDETKRTHL